MTVQIFNWVYFLCIGALILSTFLLAIVLKDKSVKTQRRVLLMISFISFAIHFLKLLIPKYADYFPVSIRKVTFENICAVNTLIFPFILLGKNKHLKDYMVYFGIISGLASLIYPTEAIGKNLLELDVIRFYLCHMIIFIVPFLMAFLGVHKLDIKRIWATPIVFLVVLCIILVNEIVLIEMGFVDMRNGDFLNPNYRNNSFVFGPTSEFKDFSSKFFDWMIPKPFKTVMVGEYAQQVKYAPVLWLLVPSFVYFVPMSAIIYFIFVKILKKGDK